MKNIMKLLLLTLVVSACSREAEVITVDDKKVEKVTIESIRTDLLSVSPKMRSATAIVLPNEEDFSAKNMYTLQDDGSVVIMPNGQREGFAWEADEQFDMVFEGTQFEGKIPKSILSHESNFNKRKKLVLIAGAAGVVRDQYYVLYLNKLNEQAMERVRIEEEVKPLVDEYLTKYICYEGVQESSDSKIKCRYIASDENPIPEDGVKAQSCVDLQERFEFNFENRMQEREFRRDLRDCRSLVADRLDSWNEEHLTPITSRRESAKGVVENILSKLKREYTGISYTYIVGANEETSMDEKSLLLVKKDDDGRAQLQDIELYMALDLGVSSFSKSNGNLKFRTYVDTRYEVQVSMLEIILDSGHGRFIRANLSGNDTVPGFGLRYTGEMSVDGIDGKKRTGILKFEFDTL